MAQAAQYAPPPGHRAELLMPAGSLVKLKTAVLYGADAVYAGTPDLSLRTQSDFSLDDLLEIYWNHCNAHIQQIQEVMDKMD